MGSIKQFKVTPLALNKREDREAFRTKELLNPQPIHELLSQTQGRRFPHLSIPRWNILPRTPQQSQARRSRKRSLDVPGFVAEFLDENVRSPRRPLSNSRQPLYCPSKPPVAPERREHVPRCRRTVTKLSVQEQPSERQYKPYSIEISPKAKVTLYSKHPLSSSRRKAVAVKNPQKTIAEPQPSPEAPSEIVSVQDESLPEINFNAPAFSFGAKLDRAQMIIEVTSKELQLDL